MKSFKSKNILLLLALFLLSTCFISGCFFKRANERAESEEKTITTLQPLEDQSAKSLAEDSAESKAEEDQAEEPEQANSGYPAEITVSSWPMASPEVMVNSSEVQGLAEAIDTYLKMRGLEDQAVSIVYEDLLSHQRYDYRGSERYQAASTVKVPMAMVVYQMMHEKQLPKDLKIAYEACEQFIDDGYSLAPEGTVLPIRVIIEQAIRHSGNTATSAIFKYFHDHGEYIHNVMDSRLGMNYGADTTMSATEAIRLMEELYYNEQNVEDYNELLRFMKTTTWHVFFNAHFPEREIAHKYGSYDSYMHDIGIVYGDRPYAFAVYTATGTGYQTLAELGWIIDQWHQNGTVDLMAMPATTLPEQASPGISYEEYYQNTEYPQPGVVEEPQEPGVNPDETAVEEPSESESESPPTIETTPWWQAPSKPPFQPPKDLDLPSP